MYRLLSILPAFLLLGCGTSRPEPPAPEPLPVEQPGIDFANWPKATKTPYRVLLHIAFDCAVPTSPEQAETQQRALAKASRGPHAQRSIIVRVNPDAFDAFMNRKPLPVGSIVVKEKHEGDAVTGPPDEYTAMIRKEPGYDPTHGDWEYVHVVTRPEKKVTRGKLSSCIDCHVDREDRDYLFRTYLPWVK